MKSRTFILLALALAGCQTNAESDRQQATELCRTDPNPGECVQTTLRNYAILDRHAAGIVAAQQAQQLSGAYYPAPVPGTDAPPLQNILPPTVRCQSVNAGLGTIQTVCR